jgi:proteasome lid subunit RPN8/RPN11
LEVLRKEVDSNIIKLSEEMAKACKDHNIDRATFFFEQAVLVSKMDELLEDSTPPTSQTERQTYVVSSLFLHDCFDFLNTKKTESLHFVTGPQLDNISILDRIVDFEIEIQNSIFAKGNSESVRKALIQLEKIEHKLQGCFHIHPGKGIASTIPSSTDLTLQETFDKGGYKVIGGIFSRDGYIRFYSSIDSKIQVYGKGVEEIDGKFYHLTKID